MYGIHEEVVADEAVTARLDQRGVDVDQDRPLARRHVAEDRVERERCSLREAIQVAGQTVLGERLVAMPRRCSKPAISEVEKRESIVESKRAAPGGQRPGAIAGRENISLPDGTAPRALASGGKRRLWTETFGGQPEKFCDNVRRAVRAPASRMIWTISAMRAR